MVSSAAKPRNRFTELRSVTGQSRTVADTTGRSTGQRPDARQDGVDVERTGAGLPSRALDTTGSRPTVNIDNTEACSEIAEAQSRSGSSGHPEHPGPRHHRIPPDIGHRGNSLVERPARAAANSHWDNTCRHAR